MRWLVLLFVDEVDFFILDLEMVNDEFDLVCALGLAVVKKGKIVAVGASYVDPQSTFDFCY